MRYIKISDTKPVAEYLASTILSHLQNHQTVLWFVSGGSAIAAAVQTSQLLNGHDVSGLSVTLTDERYGVVGHANSNWQQLIDAGFALPGAQLHPVLAGEDRPTTTAKFDVYLHNMLSKAGFKIGLFGMGPDGHTAGILPRSPATKNTDYVTDYDANFQRITMTFPTIQRLDEAVMYATGTAKKPALDQLANTVALADQPVQILKQVPKVTIFNDLRGDTL